MRLLAIAGLLTAGVAFAAPVPKGAGEADPLAKDSVWIGKLTQRGGGPDAYECEFTITKRDGEKFEADLYEKSGQLELTYLVRGTVTPADPKDAKKGFKIEFKSYEAKDVKNTSEILNVPYTGKIEGKKITGTWKLPDDSEFGNLEGDFEFEPKKSDK